LGRVNAFIPVLRIITNLCKSESLAAATEVAQFIEVSQSAGEPPCIEVERSFDGGQLQAVATTAATAILTTKIVEAAAIMLAEFIVAAPL
jgi:hypothetical protein